MKYLVITYEELESYLNKDNETPSEVVEFIDLHNVEFAISKGKGIWIDGDNDCHLFEDEESILISQDGSKWIALEMWQVNILKDQSYLN